MTRAAVCLCVALLFALHVDAHEIGKTQVQASLHDGAYQIDVVVDPDALLQTLEAYGQRTISRDVLRDLGLPRPAFLTALVTFNVGVEAGQLSVIAIAFALCAYWQRRDLVAYRRFVVLPASLAIALVGLFWTVQRALA